MENAIEQGSRPSYLTQLEDVRRLRQEGAAANHRRVTLLVQVVDDAEYRDKLRYKLGNMLVDDFEVAETLDEWVFDLGVAFLDARLVLEVFPVATDWGKVPMIQMLYDAQQRRTDAQPDEPRKPRRTATISQVEALEQTVAVSEAKAKQVPVLKKQVSQLSDELESLRARVAELERENAELRRILSESAMVQV